MKMRCQESLLEIAAVAKGSGDPRAQTASNNERNGLERQALGEATFQIPMLVLGTLALFDFLFALKNVPNLLFSYTTTFYKPFVKVW